MPLTVEQNALLRNRVRLDMISPRPRALEFLEEPEDTAEDLRKLLERASRRWPSRDEQEDTRAKKLAMPPGAGHSYFIYNLQYSPATAFSSGSVGPIGFPGTITQVIPVIIFPDTGGWGFVNFSVFFSNNNEHSPSAFLNDINILDLSTDRLWGTPIPVDNIRVYFQGVMDWQYDFRPNFPVVSYPFWIKVLIYNPTIYSATLGVTIVYQEIFPAVAQLQGLPMFMPRFAPRPPQPRSYGPPIPPFVKVRVLQGGKPLFERPIPWGALDPDLKSQFLSAAAQGKIDPHLVPMW